MNATYTAVILLSLLSFLTTWLGVVLALKLRENARAIAAGIGFSAGIMILISVLELIPEAVAAMGLGATLGSVALGIGLVWAAHFIVPHIHLVEEKGLVDPALIRSAYLVVFGLILHDVPEGFAMANAYVASPALGVLVSIAIALHNLPEEFAMSVPAVMLKSKRFLFGAALLSALAEPLGAVIGLASVSIAPALNAHFMAFAAGAMIFVSIHELIPMARRYRHIGLFVAGTVLSVAVYWLLARVTVGLALP
ncbi:MAG: zinc permease [Candidatus Muproteobacteria bacterium RBG_16_64_11]|uniref:Zinc permease n=1 Tax=Candidatus Muproteobacteria bacterium RBG_16_64_11 TaxID=1817758 RepID=A0A1F6TG10_9PROT|nr:MAG: zinc permease [Candidatus Muproteobacteria bacterium RBG_16_64_11]